MGFFVLFPRPLQNLAGSYGDAALAGLGEAQGDLTRACEGPQLNPSLFSEIVIRFFFLFFLAFLFLQLGGIRGKASEMSSKLSIEARKLCLWNFLAGFATVF